MYPAQVISSHTSLFMLLFIHAGIIDFGKMPAIHCNDFYFPNVAKFTILYLWPQIC